MAEQLMRARLGQVDADWTVASAGTRTTPGTPTHPHALEALAGFGLRPVPTPSCQVDAALIAASSLILTANQRHLRHIVRLRPDAINKTFVLRQFARVLATVPPHVVTHDPARLIGIYVDARAGLQPRDPEEDAVQDPIGGKVADFVTCAKVIDEAVAQITAHVSAAAAPTTAGSAGAAGSD